MTAPRDRAVDVARGAAILAVVVGHVLRGLAAAGLLDPTRRWYSTLDTALYLLHVPVLAGLAALFVTRSVQRRGAGAALRERVGLLVWLFVVWTAITGTVTVLAGGAVNRPLAPLDVLVGLWQPLGQLWFLPTLAVLTLVTVLLAPGRSRARAALTLLSGTVVGVVAWGHFGLWAGTQGLGVAVFFAAGAVLGAERYARLVRSRAAVAAAAVGAATYVAVVLLAAPTVPTESVSPPTVSTTLLGLIASTGGVAGVLVVSAGASRLRAAGGLALLGRHSLEIYLAHPLAAAGSRVVLTRLGVEDPLVLLVVGIAAGIVGPLVLALLVRRTGPAWLFGPPPVLRPHEDREHPRGRSAPPIVR